jgi:hypothetical protein
MALQFHWKTHESCGSDDPIVGRKDNEERSCNQPRVSRYRRCPARQRVAMNFKLELAKRIGIT